MYCVLNGHGFQYEVQTISQIFYPNEKFVLVGAPPDDGRTVCSSYSGGSVVSRVYSGGVLAAIDERRPATDNGVELRRTVRSGMYGALKKATGYACPWGELTGMKPTKLITELLEKKYTEPEIYRHMRSEYDVNDAKTRLCFEAARRGMKLTDGGRAASLYIGVPFCATRCLYCSFTSYEITRFDAGAYLGALSKEIMAVRPFFDKNKIDAIYVGGGTPTALSENDFQTLLNLITENFDTAGAREFTVEAGRPDTLSREKLRAMKTCGVTRISVNPQTADDGTLNLIGRGHTASDVAESFELARAEGFTNINADLIMGLPGETERHARVTMEFVRRLAPEGVTVHTLAIKRASRFKEEFYSHGLPDRDETERMLGVARERCGEMGLAPYYMYRQKNSTGNFENVGYCADGHECVYNVQIIAEKQTIVALGAGGVTKVYYRPENRIERVFNVKDPGIYISRIDEMIERKKIL